MKTYVVVWKTPDNEKGLDEYLTPYNQLTSLLKEAKHFHTFASAAFRCTLLPKQLRFPNRIPQPMEIQDT